MSTTLAHQVVFGIGMVNQEIIYLGKPFGPSFFITWRIPGSNRKQVTELIEIGGRELCISLEW